MISYECEGCGAPVLLLSANWVPDHGFCVACAYLDQCVNDPAELVELQKKLARGRSRDAHKGRTGD